VSERAFGVTAGLDPEIASPLAARCQELGYSSMWSNDHPGAKGLETLAEYAKGADRIDLGVAVIALDRQSPDEIASDIDRLGLDRGRLWLGLGRARGGRCRRRSRPETGDRGRSRRRRGR